jgi:hypothetical protein
VPGRLTPHSRGSLSLNSWHPSCSRTQYYLSQIDSVYPQRMMFLVHVVSFSLLCLISFAKPFGTPALIKRQDVTPTTEVADESTMCGDIVIASHNGKTLLSVYYMSSRLAKDTISSLLRTSTSVFNLCHSTEQLLHVSLTTTTKHSNSKVLWHFSRIHRQAINSLL